MPDFGITKAIRKGIKGAKVVRPGDELKVPVKKPPEPPKEAPAPPDLQPVTPSGVKIDAPEPPVMERRTQPVERPPLTPAAPKPGPAQPAQVTPPPPVEPEARRLSTLNLGDYDLDQVHQTNFDRITTTDDIKAVIADTAERNVGKINEARRGVITDEQLRGLASDLDVGEDVIREVMTRESGGTLNAERILAARQVLNASADRLVTLAKKVSSGQGTDLERIQFRRQMMFHDEYQTAFMGARAETGRALRAFGIPAGLDLDPPKLAKLKQITESMTGHDTDELAAMFAQIDTAQGVNKMARGYTRAKVAGTLQELFINSLLSGPKTHVVNASSNALFAVMQPVETALAARIGKVLPGADHVQVGEASAMIYGQITGFRDAMRYAAKAMRSGETLDQTMRFQGDMPKSISARTYWPNGAPSPSLGAAVDLLGTIIRAPTERVMAPTDELFKTLAYRSELARLAYLRVSQEARVNNLSTEEIAQRVQAFIENPPADAIRKADNAVDYATFQQPLGQTGARIQALVAQTPGLFLIAPFIRTPVNIFKAGLVERSPLGLFSARIRNEIAKGGPERDLALARLSLGTLTVTSVAMAASSGYITGGGPQDPNERKVLEATGWQPYSFVITDPNTGETTYQSYARSEPLSYVIGATADAVEILAYLDYDDETKSESEQLNTAIAAITAGVVNNTVSKTFMQGVADFSEATQDPQRYMKNYLTRTGMQLVPYAAFRRQMNQIQDPLIREGWTAIDQMRNQSGIPGWSENSPPRRDFFGEPMQYRGGSLLGVMSPWPDTTETRDPLLLELRGLLEQTNQAPINMPGRRVEGMKLTAEEYDEFVRISRTEPLVQGRTFREALQDVMDRPAYGLATPDARVDLLKAEQKRFDALARAEMEARNVTYAMRLQAHRDRQAERLGKFAAP